MVYLWKTLPSPRKRGLKQEGRVPVRQPCKTQEGGGAGHLGREPEAVRAWESEDKSLLSLEEALLAWQGSKCVV